MGHGRVVDLHVGVVGEDPLAVFLLNAVVGEGDGLPIHRRGQTGGGTAVVFRRGGVVVAVLPEPHVVHAAAVGVGEPDGLVPGIAGIAPGRAVEVGGVHDLGAGPEDLIAHGVLVVVVAPDPDDVHVRAVLIDGVDQQAGVGNHTLLEVVGAVGRPVGLQEDDLVGAGPGGEVAVKGFDVRRLKGLVAAAGAGRALGADHVDLHLVVGIDQSAAREAENLPEGGLLVARAVERAVLEVMVAEGIDLRSVGEGVVLRVGDHIVDLGLPIDLSAHAVLDVVAAVGQHPGALTLVFELRDHLQEAVVAADAVVQVGQEHGVVFGGLCRGYGENRQDRDQHRRGQDPYHSLFDCIALTHFASHKRLSLLDILERMDISPY